MKPEDDGFQKESPFPGADFHALNIRGAFLLLGRYCFQFATRSGSAAAT